MAVLMQMITKRQSNSNNYNGDDDNNTTCDYYGNCYSTWGSWGRWVVLILVIIGFLLLAFALSCLNSRRRRRQGLQPMYGTGWMAKPPPYAQYNQPGTYNYGPPPPMYTANGAAPIPAQQTGTTFQSHDGYYGHHGHPVHQDGIELQQPAHAYTRGDENVYQAPMGPPPGKN